VVTNVTLLVLLLQVHLRLKWNVGYVLLETGTLAHLFAHHFDARVVMVRFSLVALLSLGLSWWWDIKLRRRFLRSSSSSSGSIGAAAMGLEDCCNA
jgi:hypothetical protein